MTCFRSAIASKRLPAPAWLMIRSAPATAGHTSTRSTVRHDAKGHKLCVMRLSDNNPIYTGLPLRVCTVEQDSEAQQALLPCSFRPPMVSLWAPAKLAPQA